jgi:hypothetical protein
MEPMVVKDGSVCPKCGTVYYSSGDFCYACSEMKAARTPRLREWAMPVIRAILGLALILFGLVNLIEATHHPDYPRATRTVFVASMIFGVGVGVFAYSILSRPIPMWRVRNGIRSENRWASFFLSLSIMEFAYLSANQMVTRIMDIEGMDIYRIVYLLGLGSFFMLIGCMTLLRWPRTIFGVDESRQSRPVRIVISIAVMLFGMGLTALSILFIPQLNVYLAFWLMMSGIIIIFSGLVGLAGPFPRPWLHTGSESDQ